MPHLGTILGKNKVAQDKWNGAIENFRTSTASSDLGAPVDNSDGIDGANRSISSLF